MLETSVKELRKQYKALVSERNTILNIWRSLADNFLPLKRVLLQDSYEPEDVYRHMGDINQSILDSTPVKATKVLGSGMQSGMTSPSKRWFRLGHPDPNIERLPDVKAWLEEAQNIIFTTMARSNFYNNTHRCYLEDVVFGTMVMLILEDEDKGIRTLSLPVGSYVLASNFKGEIDTLYRQFFMTAEQMVDQFGMNNLSISIKNAYHSKATKNKWFSVIHAILPNKNADKTKEDTASMAYSSVYFEEKGDRQVDGITLSRSGFREKPFAAARWDVTGDSVYGDSPGMDVLSFARGLQAMTATVHKAEQRNADPAMNVPPGMKNASLAPGVRNYQTNANDKITKAADINPNTAGTLSLIKDTRQQIIEGLFNDIFRALALSPSNEMTATEVLERVSEGLRLLGPVLERLQFEAHDPMIDRIFAILLRQGKFPPIPETLLQEGADLKIEYISPLAQAQKAVGTESMTNLIGVSRVMAEMEPSVLDNLDWDQMWTLYAELIGVSPTVINGEDEVKEIRTLRAQQQQEAIERQRADQEVENLKKMSETQVTSTENAIQSAASAGVT